ncbi:MAG TPA: glycosyltransferase family 4 protein, partial [Humisphaera sp.]
SSVRTLDLRESAYKLEWMADTWHDVRASGDWLLTLAHDLRPDVVHLNGYAHAQWPFGQPTLVVGHSCVASWWAAVKREPLPQAWARYRSEVWAGLRRADLVVAPTRSMLDALHRHYGPMPSARVIPNGRDARRYWAGQKDDVVLSAGRLWDEAKNLATLDRAAEGLPWPVEVAGEDQHPEGGKASAQHVVPLGRLDETAMARKLAKAGIYCLPARYEPFGLSALEAALSGCALVLGDIPSLREVWGDAAAYVPPDDADALAATLRILIDRSNERQELARRARVHAARYTAEAMASRYLESYRQLLAGPPATDAPGRPPTSRLGSDAREGRPDKSPEFANTRRSPARSTVE